MDIILEGVVRSCMDAGKSQLLESILEPIAALIAAIHRKTQVCETNTHTLTCEYLNVTFQARFNAGAHVLEEISTKLKSLWDQSNEEAKNGRSVHALIADKAPHNLVLLLTHLYNFQVTSHVWEQHPIHSGLNVNM